MKPMTGLSALACAGSTLALLLLGVTAPRPGDGAIGVTRDKDRTVYSVGSKSQGTEEESIDREKVWDMLRNLGIIINRRPPSAAAPVAPPADK